MLAFCRKQNFVLIFIFILAVILNLIINIYTDSEYVIKCAGSYTKKLEKNNWITSTGKVPPNIELLKKYFPNVKRGCDIGL